MTESKDSIESDRARLEAIVEERKRRGFDAIQPHAPKPPAEEAKPEISIDDLLARMLGKARVATPDEIRERNWREFILPQARSSGIGDRFLYELRHGEWVKDQRAAYVDCVHSFKGVGAIVALVGPRGLGKTAIAAQIIIARARNDWNRLNQDPPVPGFRWRWTPYVKMVDLIAKYKALYSDHGSIDQERAEASRAAFVASSLKIIDELHDAEEQALKRRVLTDILDRCYSSKTDVLLISNQTRAEFEQSVGPSVMSRLAEHGRIVPCDWPSLRTRQDGMPEPRHA